MYVLHNTFTEQLYVGKCVDGIDTLMDSGIIRFNNNNPKTSVWNYFDFNAGCPVL